jgi:hypothetical protein
MFTGWSVSAETESAAAESMARPYEEFKPPDPEDQVVCRRERVTGSMIPTRVCKTKRDIRLEKEASQRSMTDMTSQSGVNRGPVNPVTGDN